MPSQGPSDETSPLLGPSVTSGSSAHHASPQPHVLVAIKAQTSLAFKIAATMFSFFVLGLFGSSTGVMLPRISHYYNLSDIHVSFIFIAGPVGYVIAAQSNAFIHSRFGQRGVAVLGPAFHLLSAILIATHLPFPVVLLGAALNFVGTGLLDGSWCAFAGAMENGNAISGLLHGSFSAGAAIGPLLSGALLSGGHRPWFDWYYVLAAASVLELVILFAAFKHEDASRYAEDKQDELTHDDSDRKAMLRYRATWLCAAYFLGYVGTETAISGWIVSFMSRARHASPYLANLSSSGFWGGMALGRMALGAVADRIGVRRAAVIYLLCGISLEAMFAAVRVPILTVIIVTLIGFFMGPLFPSGIVVLTRALPSELHIVAVSFVASVGQVGAAVMPFSIGAVIQGLGIGALRYAVIVLTFLTLLLWIVFSKSQPKAVVAPSEDEEEA